MMHVGNGTNELDFLILESSTEPLSVVLFGRLPPVPGGGSLCVQEILRDIRGPWAVPNGIAAGPYVCLEGAGPVNSDENSSGLSPISYNGSAAALVAVWASGNAEVDTITYNIAPSPCP
jgi:hypothetical protein